MADAQPLNKQIPIIDPVSGCPTDYFIKWAQQFNNSALGEIFAGAGIDISAGPTIAADQQAILDAIDNTQGSILYRDADEWKALAPGTAGHFLKTNGVAANPEWAAAGGGGGGGTSWANGTGERRFLIQATASGGSTGNPGNSLGVGPVNNFYWAANATVKNLVFDFLSPKVVDGFGVQQDASNAGGTWTIAGSNDNSIYTTLISDFIWGGTPYGPNGFVAGNQYIREFTNTTAYRYYRLTLNTGSSNNRWVQWFGFKCEPL